MTYTVLWVPKAEQDLATLWTNAIDRDAVTRAANEIDNRLRTDPETVGEARSYDLRILLVQPLGVTFQVRAQDRIVQVLDVWQFQRRP
jgi:plasmid stabilization system protein ParE